MPAPTVTVIAPPPADHPDPGILRPRSLVRWTGGTGPFTVLHQWDTVNTFDSVDLVEDSNAAATSPDTGIPPSDLGPAGTGWFYRATVTDTSDAAATSSPITPLTFFDPVAFRRYLYALGNVGVAFDPTDTTTPGPADDDYAADGFTIAFRRYLHALASVGVGFDPIDTPAAGWDPEATGNPLIGPGDGFALDFRRYLYQLANVTTDTPTPHIWYVFPSFGREGWEFQVVGYGFGDTQGEYAGGVTLNGLAVTIISWELVAASGSDRAIDPTVNLAEPIHQLIRATVPSGGSSGLIVVCTDGP